VFYVLILPLALLAVFTILNSILFRSLRYYAKIKLEHQPKVSLLIPARNEQQNLELLLPTLVAQDYANLEIIVLNDHSTDRTLEIAQEYAARDARLHVIEGGVLLEGWLGKPNACRQLAEAATGEILVFTDADTLWQPDAITLCVKAMQATNSDAMCAWPQQILSGWFSSLVQPWMTWSLLALLPVWLIPNPKHKLIVSANGQMLAFRKNCYSSIGGFEPVKHSILEDMALARNVKAQNMRFVLLNGLGSVKCKMYSSTQETFDGFAKAAFVGLGSSVPALFVSILFFAWLFLAPWIWLFVAIFSNSSITLPIVAVLLSLLGRFVADLEFGYPLYLWLQQPISMIGWAVIAIASWRRFHKGQTSWKGRVYDLKNGPKG
jgi:chlorobactene glucosyltransferase